MTETTILAVIVFGAMLAVAIFGLVKSNAAAARLDGGASRHGHDRRGLDHDRGLSGTGRL
ncbi:MAG: hypothetical protein LPK02_10585 [Rhodobacterales bacterium]|nr:hypothetical protein [Rhodobacterales bacterium]MDX5413479.1 hypothetical protein [Rhodobacterales bacterium]